MRAALAHARVQARAASSAAVGPAAARAAAATWLVVPNLRGCTRAHPAALDGVPSLLLSSCVCFVRACVYAGPYIAAAIVPGIITSVLFWFDHGVSSKMGQQKVLHTVL